MSKVIPEWAQNGHRDAINGDACQPPQKVVVGCDPKISPSDELKCCQDSYRMGYGMGMDHVNKYGFAR